MELSAVGAYAVEAGRVAFLGWLPGEGGDVESLCLETAGKLTFLVEGAVTPKRRQEGDDLLGYLVGVVHFEYR